MPDTTVKTASTEMKPRVTLRLPEAPAILHVLASRSKRDSVAGKLDKLTASGRFVPRTAGPDKWLVLAPTADASRLTAELGKALGDTASLLDQSDGRVLIELSGNVAREALAKGTAVDLDPGIFPIGHSAITAFGHVTVHLTRSAEDTYELIVMRSYAEALQEMLVEAAREFGCYREL